MDEQPRSRLLDSLGQLSKSPAFAYGSLLALQAKVVWGIARFRDLTAGDTASYFIGASRWAEELTLNPVTSPLYVAFFGSLRWIFDDPFTMVLAHRLLILAAVDVCVLAVFRGLLPHAIAWLLAAWFALLPINFDSLYEVHLFSAVPPLLAVALVSRLPCRRDRASALAVLLVAVLLVRHELAIATALWAVYCLARDGLWPGAERLCPSRSARWRSYAAALAVAALVTSAAYSRSTHDLGELRELFRAKQSFNLCQVYAFGYAQRHDDWTGNVWTDCRDLIRRDFGHAEPTLFEAWRRNPGAMLEHVAWNVRLIPAGVQLQLFDSALAPATPDYLSVELGSWAAALASGLALVLLAAGGVLLWRGRSQWSAWLRERADGWALLGCLVASSLVVMLLVRPRPSYMFGQAVAFQAAIGMAAVVVTRRWWPRFDAGWIVPPLALLLVLVSPPRYHAETIQAFGQRGQPLRQAVDRLWPFRHRLAGSDQRLVTRLFPFELCAYLGGNRRCTGLGFDQVMQDKPEALSARAWIEDQGVQWLYADELAGDPAWGALLQELQAADAWERIAPPAGSRERWGLWRRTGQEARAFLVARPGA